MKYLKCECCNFLAVIPIKDEYKELICPFCYISKCEHGGKFVEITVSEFIIEADIFSDRQINLSGDKVKL